MKKNEYKKEILKMVSLLARDDAIIPEGWSCNKYLLINKLKYNTYTIFNGRYITFMFYNGDDKLFEVTIDSSSIKLECDMDYTPSYKKLYDIIKEIYDSYNIENELQRKITESKSRIEELENLVCIHENIIKEHKRRIKNMIKTMKEYKNEKK